MRKALGADSMELQASTVAEALTRLRARLDPNDAEAQALLDQSVVLVNGRNIAYLGGEQAALGPDDEMTVLQQVAGG